jgi:hypothetical protein
MKRVSAISPDRANQLGAHAAEAENQIRWALESIARADYASAKERLRDAQERCDIIRQACYWEPGEVQP